MVGWTREEIYTSAKSPFPDAESRRMACELTWELGSSGSAVDPGCRLFELRGDLQQRQFIAEATDKLDTHR